MAKKVRQAKISDVIFQKQPSQFDMLQAIAGDSKNIVTLDDLDPIPAVPSIFTSFNRAVVLGGAPGNTTWVVHGPPGGGKTAFCLGIGTSFVKHNHVAAYIDAEHALEKTWVKALQTATKGIMLFRPDNFEHAYDQVDIWINNFAKAKANGDIPKNRLFAIFVDTIHKMPPKREIDSLSAFKPNSGQSTHGGENINKGWGMLRANMITTWIDHLTPLVSKHGVSFITVAHEKEERSDNWGKSDYKVKGGKTLLYEAMVRVRVEQGDKQYEKVNGKKILVGQEHVATVEKNKVGYPHEYFRFYTSNGKGTTSAGFDYAKEAVTESLIRNVLIKTGSWYYLPYDRSQKFQGKDQLINHFNNNQEALIEFQEFLNDNLINPDEYNYEKEDDQTTDE